METVNLSIIAICCVFIAYKQFKKTRLNNYSEKKETEDSSTNAVKEPLFYKPDIQIFIEGIEYTKDIAKITRTVAEHYRERDHVTDIHIPLHSIKIYWIMDNKPNTSLFTWCI